MWDFLNSNGIGIKRLQATLRSCFHMKDFGLVTYFLSLEVHRSNRGIMLSQNKYIKELLGLACLIDSNSATTAMEVNLKFHKEFGEPISDPAIYRKLVGSLIYLTNTHHDISYAVNTVSQFMTNPQHHMAAVFRILRSPWNS